MPGGISAEEIRANLAFLQEPIPAGFWDEMKRAGLLNAGAPVSQ